MINWQKLSLAIFLIICMSVTGYLLRQFFLDRGRPADLATNKIAFMAAASPGLSGLFGNYDIYVMTIDSPGLTHLTKQAGSDSMPTWAPQGDRIAYARIDGLYIINADGSDQPELLWPSFGRGTILHPAWSPDSSKIAFSEGVIYVLDLKTRQVVQLTDGPTPSDQPTWSPDGRKIAFTLSPYLVTPGGEPDSSIAVINVDGSGLIQLTPHNNSGSPKWSPDGSQIVFQRNGNIYVMSADGTNVKALTQDRESNSPTWSPSGTKIAFVSTINRKCGPRVFDGPRFCTSELRVMDVDGSNVIVVRSKKNENIVNPAWAP